MQGLQGAGQLQAEQELWHARPGHAGCEAFQGRCSVLMESRGNTILDCSALRNCRGGWVLVAQRSCTATLRLHPIHSHPGKRIGWWTETAVSLRAAQELALAPGQMSWTAAHLSPPACPICCDLWRGCHSVPLSDTGQVSMLERCHSTKGLAQVGVSAN